MNSIKWCVQQHQRYNHQSIFYFRVSNKKLKSVIKKGLASLRRKTIYHETIYFFATHFTQHKRSILHTKRKNRSTKHIVSNDVEHLKIVGAKIDHQFREQKINQLYTAISTLKEIDRIIMGRLLEGNSYKEIANITDLSTTNIGAKINRIKKILRKKITNHG